MRQHATGPGDNGHVHPFSHTILLWNMGYGVMPNNAFLSAIIIKGMQTKFSTIISTKQFYLPFSLSFYHYFPVLKSSKSIIFLF
jgi:hypothetical protein